MLICEYSFKIVKMLSYFPLDHDKNNVYSIGFYNLENLYDIYNDPNTDDDEFTPESPKKWNLKRYERKIEHLSRVITQMGTYHSSLPPIFIGVAEVENAEVVRDLVAHANLKDFYYDYVHFDSPDERGIEVAFLYQKKHFELIEAKAFPLEIFEPDGQRIFTRDVLKIEGNFLGERMYIFVNHWPSRRDGSESTEFKRLAASQLVSQLIQDVKSENQRAKIVVMGDFNDEPNNMSMQHLIKENDLYNPMQSLKDKEKGSSFSQEKWYLFDQILFSKNFFDKESNPLLLKYTEVFEPIFIQTWEGKRKSKPYRTYFGKHYQDGFSDHFPVVAYLERLSPN